MPTAKRQTTSQAVAGSKKRVRFTLTPGQLAGARAVSTPREDMVIVELGVNRAPTRVAKDQQAGTILARVGQHLSKPGLDRKRLFATASRKPVYAYSVDPSDPDRMVREDESGKRTVGKVVNGMFKPLTA